MIKFLGLLVQVLVAATTGMAAETSLRNGMSLCGMDISSRELKFEHYVIMSHNDT